MRIALQGVGFRHPHSPALFIQVDAVFTPGRLAAVVGPSGSGKSTLLSILAGFRAPTEGAVAREGVDRIGWVLQTPVGVARRTAIDLVAQPFLYQGLSRPDALSEAEALLQRFQLDAVAHREFRRLSGGEAQRLAFARGAASSADALLLDEPTAQLDTTTAATVGAVIRELVDEQRIVILATHDAGLKAECDDLLDVTDYSAAA